MVGMIPADFASSRNGKDGKIVCLSVEGEKPADSRYISFDSLLRIGIYSRNGGNKALSELIFIKHIKNLRGFCSYIGIITLKTKTFNYFS